MEGITPSGVPICPGDAFAWEMAYGIPQSPTNIAERGYERGYRDGSYRKPSSGGGGGSDEWKHTLAGQTLSNKPTVTEANDALKKVFTKLGGTVVSCFAGLLLFGASVETAPLGALNEDSNVVVRVELPDTPGEIAAATNAVLVAANAYTDGATNATLTAANAYTDEHSGTDPEAVRGIVREELGLATNGLRSVMDNVSRVSEPGLWYRGPVDWAGTGGSELEPQPSFSGSLWTWNVLGSGGTARFEADGDEGSVRLAFHGAGVVSPAAKFYAGLATGAALSNETFVTSSFVTNRVAVGTASMIPGIRDLLSKTNATEISDSFETNSIVGRLANDSIGFEVRGKTLAFMDGDVDIWTCENGGGGSGSGVDTNAVRDIAREEIGTATNGLRRVDDLAVYAEVEAWTHGELPDGVTLRGTPHWDDVLSGWSWFHNDSGSPHPGFFTVGVPRDYFGEMTFINVDGDAFTATRVRSLAPTGDKLRSYLDLNVYSRGVVPEGPWTWTSDNADLLAAIGTKIPVRQDDGTGRPPYWLLQGEQAGHWICYSDDSPEDAVSIEFYFENLQSGDFAYATATRPDDVLHPTGDHLVKESQVVPKTGGTFIDLEDGSVHTQVRVGDERSHGAYVEIDSNSAGSGGAYIHVVSSEGPASVKKNGKEVATEEQVDAKRDKPDAKCYADAYGPWSFNGDDEGGRAALEGANPVVSGGDNNVYELLGLSGGYSTPYTETILPTDLSHQFQLCLDSPDVVGHITVTRAKAAFSNETFVTQSFVTNRLMKVRAALDLLPASPSVSDLVDALKTALEE